MKDAQSFEDTTMLDFRGLYKCLRNTLFFLFYVIIFSVLGCQSMRWVDGHCQLYQWGQPGQTIVKGSLGDANP